LRENTNGSGNTEENSIVTGFGQSVILEENTGVSINVGEWVPIAVSLSSRNFKLA